LSRVGKNQCPVLLMKNEVVVLTRLELRFFDAQFAGHAQMQAEPNVIREPKEHLLAMCFRIQKGRSWQLFAQRVRRNPAKNSASWMQGDGFDGGTEAGVPLRSVIFNFSQFGHSGT